MDHFREDLTLSFSVTVITCAWLPAPANGYLTSNTQQCGRTVQYNCDKGYELRGARRRRCQSDGKWSENEPVCESNDKFIYTF